MNLYLFKTNVLKEKAAKNLSNILRHYFKITSVEFENRVLKIEARYLSTVKVERAMQDLGYKCRAM